MSYVTMIHALTDYVMLIRWVRYWLIEKGLKSCEKLNLINKARSFKPNKTLLDSNWRENYYNWVCFYSNKFVCGVGGNTILFWITNMTNYHLFYVKIAIWKWIVHYFSSYLHDKYCIFYLKNIFWLNTMLYRVKKFK